MLGIHIRKKNTLSQSLEDAQNDAAKKWMKSAQIFLLNPMSGMNTTTNEDIAAIKAFIKKHKKIIITHGSYADIPWASKSTELIKQEFRLCYKAGVSGLIVHLGAKTNDNLDSVIAAILESKQKYLEEVILWLEINSHKQDENTFETPEKINKLFRRIYSITKDTPLLYGLCIDTAHLWACGTSMATYSAAKKFLEALDTNIPIMFHLNDSTEEFASGKDIHAKLAEGKIWRQYKGDLSKSGIAYIVNYAKKNNSVVILERHTDDINKDIKVLKTLGFI
jgi:deoxyribonuclease IV